jgi:hypothetical protein
LTPAGLPGGSDIPGDRTNVQFAGAIQSIKADAVMVDGNLAALTPNTDIKGHFGIGDLVKVQAVMASDGSLTATEIEAAHTSGDLRSTPEPGGSHRDGGADGNSRREGRHPSGGDSGSAD